MPQGNRNGLRVLVVRVGAMGDVLHGLPAVAALRDAMPDAFIGWAVEPCWAALLQSSAGNFGRLHHRALLDRVHAVPAKQWSKAPLSPATARSVLTLRRELRAERYDLAIDLQGSIRSSVIARISGAKRVVGSDSPREAPARLLYSQRVPLHAVHVVEQAVEIVSAAVGRPLRAAPAPLPIDGGAEAWCDALVGDDRRRVVFLAPSAGWGAKQWPADKFAEVATSLHAAGFRVLVNRAGANDTAAAAVLRAANGNAEAADATLAQLIALLRRVSLVVAGDTGPLHLAAALGTPTVALFGPTDPARNGPWGSHGRILRSGESTTTYKRTAQTEQGLAGIPAQQVLQAAGALLGRTVPYVCATAHTIR